MIGDRIKQARQSAGLSLRALAEQIDVSAMAISKYERNENTPSSGVLLALAKALGVRVEYFFRRVDARLERINFRKQPDMSEKEASRIFAEVNDQLERWLELETFIPTPWATPFKLPKGLPKRIDDSQQIEDVAIKLRHAWDLGLNPIPDLIDTLESHGIKVFVVDYDAKRKFNGLSAKADGKPVIVVGRSWPGDNQRFTLAHELGHLVLAGRLSAELDEETACHRFAGAFLVPKPAVFKALGNSRTWLEPQELMLLKQEWGLSMGGWTYRALNNGILPKSRMSALWKHFRAHGWREREPDPQYKQEEARIFKQLVYHALAEDLIGESKAAELLGMSLTQLRDCRNMECSDAAHQ
jgi:Zn-dependent peptidase ImmA (M78 family)/DNA-binding XRE family transcriptional regulator